MNNKWLTKEKDMHLAQSIMEAFAVKQQTNALGLFELVVSLEEKRMDFQLSAWVFAMAQQFNSLYGAHQGDYVTRQVIGHCLTQGHTLH